MAYAKTITQAVTISGSAEHFTSAHPLIRSLGLSYQYGWGATITLTQSYSTTVDKGPANMEFCVIKQNIWWEKSGYCPMYGPSGYGGLSTMNATLWQSGTKEEAERRDHRYSIRARSY